MSILDTTPITSPLDAADWVYDKLVIEGPTIGLPNIEYNAKLVRDYPAAVVTPGRKDKVLHSTQFFRVVLEVMVSVYHARLTSSHRERTREDLQMCNDLEALIETGEMNCDGRATFCFVNEIVPGLITRAKGEQVVGSRMTVVIDSRERMVKG